LNTLLLIDLEISCFNYKMREGYAYRWIFSLGGFPVILLSLSCYKDDGFELDSKSNLKVYSKGHIPIY